VSRYQSASLQNSRPALKPHHQADGDRNTGNRYRANTRKLDVNSSAFACLRNYRRRERISIQHQVFHTTPPACMRLRRNMNRHHLKTDTRLKVVFVRHAANYRRLPLVFYRRNAGSGERNTLFTFFLVGGITRRAGRAPINHPNRVIYDKVREKRETNENLP